MLAPIVLSIDKMLACCEAFFWSYSEKLHPNQTVMTSRLVWLIWQWCEGGY